MGADSGRRAQTAPGQDKATSVSTRVLIAASSKARAKTLAQTVAFLKRGIDVIVGDERPKRWDHYRLLVCELGPHLPSPEPLLAELPAQTIAQHELGSYDDLFSTTWDTVPEEMLA